MSARPDLTTEELIRWCEEMAEKRARRGDTTTIWTEEGVRYHAIAQRLRSERPAVTPEMREVVEIAVSEVLHTLNRAERPDRVPHTTLVEAVEARLAVLSVSSTKGKP